MQGHADALPPTLERSEVEYAKVVGGTDHDARQVSHLDRCEIGREAYPLYNHQGVIGVASAWLAFFIIVAIQHIITRGN